MIFTLNMIVLSGTVILISMPVITGVIGSIQDPESGKSVFNY
jgi:hypothetical protein